MSEGRVLFVCTGNQCRSPMAEALLRHLVEGRCDLEVASAGTMGSGTPPPEAAVAVMAERGLDISGRPSRRLTAEVLAGADLVVGMARQHLVEVATLHPPAWDRAFTFADLLDRAAAAGGRMAGESLAEWARRMSAGRTRQSVLAAGAAGDVPDPIGGTRRDFEQSRDLLERMVARLAPDLCPAPAGSAPGAAGGPTRVAAAQGAPEPAGGPAARPRWRPWRRA